MPTTNTRPEFDLGEVLSILARYFIAEVIKTEIRNQLTIKKGDKMSDTPANGPSKTGNPSGPGRGNNPPKD